MLNKVLVFTSDVLGKGDESLGRKVLDNLLKALAQQADKPGAVFLLNSAVHLAIKDSDSDDLFKELEKAGTRVYACLTCIRHYNLTEQIEPYRVSSINTLVELMKSYEVVTF